MSSSRLNGYLYRAGLTGKFQPNRFLKTRFLVAGFYCIVTFGFFFLAFLSVSWGFLRQKVQFLQRFKAVKKLFWKLEWELWICPIKSTFFFGLHLFYCCGFTVIVAFLCVLFLLRILLLIILSLWGFILTSYGRI